MSRIGKKPVPIPAGVTVQVAGQKVSVKGKHGESSHEAHPRMTVVLDDAKKELRVERPADDRESLRPARSHAVLINNMVSGVVTPFEKKLEIVGVGYQAALSGKTLTLQVGFANAIKLPVPAGVTCEVPDATHVNIKGADRQAVGQFAAEIRAVRPPEPYKGKGIKYHDERVKRKAGKAFGS